MTFSTFRLEHDGALALLTFATPERLNAIGDPRLDDLEAALTKLETDPTIGALIISGDGDRAFCVGLDIDLLERAFADLDYFERSVRRLAAIIARIEALPFPTIAAINGLARAGGFEIALGCDFIVVGTAARIGDVHTSAGVLPACVTSRLARHIGMARAKDLLFSAEWLHGAEAVQAGLAIRAFPQETLARDARAFARRFTNKPRPTIAALKASLHATRDLPLPQAVAHELDAFSHYMREQPFGQEGYRAYREGRSPDWGDATERSEVQSHVA